MAEKKHPANPEPLERRRFLSESLRGSVPMLLGWATARVRELSQLVQEPPARPKNSPPPRASLAPPANAQESLDKKQAEFARENPDATQYPST